jgi:hypothetical protein
MYRRVYRRLRDEYHAALDMLDAELNAQIDRRFARYRAGKMAHPGSSKGSKAWPR